MLYPAWKDAWGCVVAGDDGDHRPPPGLPRGIFWPRLPSVDCVVRLRLRRYRPARCVVASYVRCARQPELPRYPALGRVVLRRRGKRSARASCTSDAASRQPRFLLGGRAFPEVSRGRRGDAAPAARTRRATLRQRIAGRARQRVARRSDPHAPISHSPLTRRRRQAPWARFAHGRLPSLLDGGEYACRKARVGRRAGARSLSSIVRIIAQQSGVVEAVQMRRSKDFRTVQKDAALPVLGDRTYGSAASW